LSFFELMVLRLYYLGMFKDKRPEIFPLFFQVDWAPLILKFLLNSEGKHYDCRGTLVKCTNHVAHIVCLCLQPFFTLRPAVALYRFALDARRSAQLEGHVSYVSYESYLTIEDDAHRVAIAGIVLGGLATLRQLVKAIHLEGEHCSIVTNYCGK
jgi:hypothetical protein